MNKCKEGHTWTQKDIDVSEQGEDIEIIINCEKCDAHCTGVCYWQE